MRETELDAPSLQIMEGHLQTSMEVWVDNDDNNNNNNNKSHMLKLSDDKT